MSTLFRNLDPKRFEVPLKTLLWDRFMNYFIKLGGLAVILSVFGIFLFIFFQVLPLFSSSKVEPIMSIPTEPIDGNVILGIDEWGEYPLFLDRKGVFHFHDIDYQSGRIGERLVVKKTPQLNFQGNLTIQKYDPATQKIFFASDQGEVQIVQLSYKPLFEGDRRTITASLKSEPLIKLERPERVVDVDFTQQAGLRTIAVLTEDSDCRKRLRVIHFAAKTNLFGKTTLKRTVDMDLSDCLPSEPSRVLVDSGGLALMVQLVDDRIVYLRKSGNNYLSEQVIDSPTIGKITSIFWLLGRSSLVVGSEQGELAIISQSLNSQTNRLQFQTIKKLTIGTEPIERGSISLRNRAFLVQAGKTLHLYYATTGEKIWQHSVGAVPKAIALNPKYDKIFVLDRSGELTIRHLEDPHPESSWATFFNKLWYEGQSEPQYVWQSTGGDSGFEPKLSMVPLIFGALKGTLYALLFAIPIAILAAIYTSQFLKPSYKKVIKPAMEIMASLPSVVLGFMGALVLAPIMDSRMPSFIAVLVAAPLFSILIGWGWGTLPKSTRNLIPNGMEFVVFIPILLLVSWFFWQYAGPCLESQLFYVSRDGEKIVDFRSWWTDFYGLPFEQRNCLVVGIMMGFAVIPIIFTIADDSMTNVPVYLRSASLALGASRWQTTVRVVLPTAFSGIFSALMIGFGRAVGETMIMVMATGNTPIMTMNLFDGMRTLSANIAVELPEAPHHSTLYRALFLGALLLFLLTFVLNTVAEILRQRIRNKYKTI